MISPTQRENVKALVLALMTYKRLLVEAWEREAAHQELLEYVKEDRHAN